LARKPKPPGLIGQIFLQTKVWGKEKPPGRFPGGLIFGEELGESLIIWGAGIGWGLGTRGTFSGGFGIGKVGGLSKTHMWFWAQRVWGG